MSMTIEQKLKRAVTLLWIDFAVGLIIGSILYIKAGINHGAMPWVFVIVCSLIYAFIIWKIKQGQNWARIVSLVFFILGLISLVIQSATFSMTESALTQMSPNLSHTVLILQVFVLPSIQRIIEAVAMYLLFTKDMSEIFKKKKS